MIEEPLPNPFDPAQNGALVSSDVLSGITEEIEDGPKIEKPNFPFFWPIVYHSINLEIQQRYSFIVRMCYCGAVSFTWSLFLNFFASFFTEKINDGKTSTLQDFILSLSALIFFPSVLFYIQYFPVYISFREGKNFNKISTIQNFVIVAMILLCAGFRGTGIIGISYVIDAFKNGSVWNRILGLTFTIWHVVNIFLELIFKFTLMDIIEVKGGLLEKGQSD